MNGETALMRPLNVCTEVESGWFGLRVGVARFIRQTLHCMVYNEWSIAVPHFAIILSFLQLQNGQRTSSHKYSADDSICFLSDFNSSIRTGFCVVCNRTKLILIHTCFQRKMNLLNRKAIFNEKKKWNCLYIVCFWWNWLYLELLFNLISTQFPVQIQQKCLSFLF